MKRPILNQHTHLAAAVDLDDQTEASIAKDPVVVQARRIARRTRSALTLLCFQSAPSLLSNLQSLVSGRDIEERQSATRAAIFELAGEIEREEGVSVRCEGLQAPFEASFLTDWLHSTPADLLLLPKPAAQTTAMAAMNGFSRLIRQTGVPVWFVEQGSRPQDGVVAAVSEGAEKSGAEMRALDYEVVDAARGVGELFDAELHLVQAADEPPATLGSLASANLTFMDAPPQPMAEEGAAARAKKLAEKERSLQSFARTTSVADELGEILIEEGKASSVVSSSAEMLQAGLIVMGASDKSRWETMVNGGTVEATLARAPCDVLYVKNGDGEHVRPQALLSHSELQAQQQPSEVDLIVQPRRHFATPLVVVRDEQLSRQSKVLILEAWEEELENESANEQNMPQQVYEKTFDPNELNLVRRALARLGARSGGLAA